MLFESFPNSVVCQSALLEIVIGYVVKGLKKEKGDDLQSPDSLI